MSFYIFDNTLILRTHTTFEYYRTTAKKTSRIELISTVGSLHIGLFLLHTSTTGNRGFAVRPRPGRMAKAQKRTAKSLPCVFHRDARQTAHGSILHGKVPLSCAMSDNAR
jgi:hypothetical protein